MWLAEFSNSSETASSESHGTCSICPTSSPYPAVFAGMPARLVPYAFMPW